MRNGFVVIIAGVLRRWRHVCPWNLVGTQQTVRRMLLIDPQTLDGWVPGPNGAGSSCVSDMVSLPPAEASTVQGLMDLSLPSLPHFAGLGVGPQQVHAPWTTSIDLPASPATSRLDTSGEENRVGSASPCLDLDGLSSYDDDIGTSVGLDDLSVTLLCGSDEVFSPVNSDQVLLDVDFPRSRCRQDAPPDVLLVDAPPVRRPGGPRQSVTRVPRVNACRGGFHDNLPGPSLDGCDCYVSQHADAHTTAGGYYCSGHEYGHCYQS